MARTKRSTIRAIWLGEALRQLRDEARLTAREAGAHLGRDASSITRMEYGEIPVSAEILDSFMDMCGISDPYRRTDLQMIRRDAAQPGWWDGYRSDVAPSLMDRAWVESKAKQVRAFDMAHMPGLLQTPEYAEAVMRAVDVRATDEEISRWLEVRMTRQHVLSKHQPTQLRCVVDQSLLTRITGGPSVMKGQLDHLATMGKRQNIVVRVLPSGEYVGATGSFEVFTLADPYPVIGHVATPVGDVCVEGDSVGELSNAYDRLWRACLSRKASDALIRNERSKL